ncbi:MAG: TrkA family potassium uptake protein [Chitinophagales bacterium]|nr:TrkA family potassium uptake protein [Chitinophagales bacterium]
MKFIIFGLGHFGHSLSTKLTSMGHEVLGVDKNIDRVESYKDEISHTLCLDATDMAAVSGLPLSDADAVIVAIGNEDEGAGIMTVAMLKRQKVKRIIGRVTSPLQKTVLEAMEINEFVDPERETAERMASSLDIKGVLDSFQISERFRIMEIDVPDRFIGETIKKVEFKERHKVTLLTIIRKDTHKNILGINKSESVVLGVLPPEFVMESGDVLVLFGELSNIEKLMR